MTTIKTNVAASAVGGGQIDVATAMHIETLAGHAVTLRAQNATLGISADAFEAVKGGAAYRALTPAQQGLLAKVYAELIAQAATAMTDIANAAGAARQPDIRAAFQEIHALVQDQIAHARRHGPGRNVTPPSSPAFSLANHPEAVLRHVGRVKGDIADPHILVTYDASRLEQERTNRLIAAGDLTPATVVAALRTVLAGRWADVELRSQSEADYKANKPAITPEKIAPPTLSFRERVQAAAAALQKAAALETRFALVHEVFYYAPELSPAIGVRIIAKLDDPGYADVADEVEKAAHEWLANNGFEVARGAVNVLALDAGTPV